MHLKLIISWRRISLLVFCSDGLSVGQLGHVNECTAWIFSCCVTLLQCLPTAIVPIMVTECNAGTGVWDSGAVKKGNALCCWAEAFAGKVSYSEWSVYTIIILYLKCKQSKQSNLEEVKSERLREMWCMDPYLTRGKSPVTSKPIRCEITNMWLEWSNKQYW